MPKHSLINLTEYFYRNINHSNDEDENDVSSTKQDIKDWLLGLAESCDITEMSPDSLFKRFKLESVCDTCGRLQVSCSCK